MLLHVSILAVGHLAMSRNFVDLCRLWV